MTLRRLIDLPGLEALEYKALMRRDFAESEARAEHPELDEASVALFGLTADQAAEIPLPSTLRAIAGLPPQQQADLFEAAGWDVTDSKRRPLRTLAHWNQQLWLAAHGVAGRLPFQAEAEQPDGWIAGMAADAARFRKR